MLTKLRSLSREVVPVHLYGHVSIDPSAVIAPGVLLQAEANSQIKIGAGVCIGAGTIVHATGGNLYLEAGVCLGRGVLIIGSGSIDRDACIGAGTTVIDPQIAAGAVIPTHSLLGDRSRNDASVVEPEVIPVTIPLATDPTDIWDSPMADGNEPNSSKSIDEDNASSATATDPPPDREIVVKKATNNVAGRAQFDSIKRALFPNSATNSSQ